MLVEYAGVSPMYGIKTGFNAAFVVDGATRERLIREDARSEELIKPYLRGQDIDRWVSDWAGQWMIAIASSGDLAWPWSGEKEADEAERAFAATYPAIRKHLVGYRGALRARQDQGRFYWELRSCAYYDKFEVPKIVYNDIMWRPQFCIDRTGASLNNTAYFLPCDDPWLLACLNAPLGWWFAWRAAQHAKDEALRYFTTFVEAFPIAGPEKIDDVHAAVTTLSKIHTDAHEARRLLASWYRQGWDIERIPDALREPFVLTGDQFIAAIRKALPRTRRLTAAEIEHIRREYANNVAPLPEGWSKRLGTSESWTDWSIALTD